LPVEAAIIKEVSLALVTCFGGIELSVQPVGYDEVLTESIRIGSFEFY
jgi:hypothetical protein